MAQHEGYTQAIVFVPYHHGSEFIMLCRVLDVPKIVLQPA
jgi:hypothetical protein